MEPDGVEVVQNHGEGKLAEVIPMQRNLLDALAEFTDLRLFRVVKKRVLRWGVVKIDLAEEGALGVVEVTALGLDGPPGFA